MTVPPAPAFAHSMGPRLSARASRVVFVIAAGLLAVHFALAVLSKRSASTTSDELAHLTGGLSYWVNNDYRLQPENGNLPQRWAALPARLDGATLPPLEGNAAWRLSDVWRFGYEFFYQTDTDHFPRLMAGRAMIALFSVGTGMLVFWWSRRLFGDIGALVSAAFFAFSPDFLAHGALVTSDVCMTFFLLAAVTAWWAHLHDARLRTAWLSAAVLGLAFVAKFSAVLLVPMMIVMAGVRALSPAPLQFGRWTFTTRAGKLGAAALSAMAHALVVAVVIWAFYGFRFTAFNPELPPADSFIRPWASYVGKTGVLGEVTRTVAALRLLPEAFLYGFDYVLATTASRAAFLNGEYSVTGWRTFFLWTFLLKTTLPVLIACALLAWHFARRLATRTVGIGLYAATPLLVLFVVYWATSLTSQLNIGHRHILPTYPVLFIAAGAFGTWVVSRRVPATLAVAALLAWHAFEAVRISPHHLAYFNPIAGGPANGWRHLVDSSLDWGQDLPALKRWLDTHARGERVFLSYFGTGEPDYYDIKAERLTFLNNFNLEPRYVRLSAGTYCVSATVLQQVYTAAPGPWTAAREKEYQELRALEPLFARFTNEPQSRAELTRELPVERWHSGIRRHEWLRMARLTAYLRTRKPDANAGYSILIYRLSEEEVRGATAGTMGEWLTLIEKESGAGP